MPDKNGRTSLIFSEQSYADFKNNQSTSTDVPTFYINTLMDTPGKKDNWLCRLCQNSTTTKT
jgi:hypothetical protein